MSSLAKIPMIAEISTCDSLFITQIIAPAEGVLHIMLGEAGSIPELSPDDFTKEFIDKHGLSRTKKPRRNFQLIWERCIAYAATDETYAPNDKTSDQPTFSCRWFASFDESCFLRYVRQTTYAVDDHALVLKHIRVGSYNWVVDVACNELPTVLELETEYR